ncbi:MAG: alpha/beta fold hydrolase [Alphaproteobacteria bacterium]
MTANSRRNLRPLSAHIGMAVSSYANVSGGMKFPGKVEEMLRGIQAYYAHPYEAPPLSFDVLWQKGTVSVKAVAGAKYNPAHPAILLVPSLINSAKILDLMPDRSLLRWLQEKSVNAYLLDWGNVTDDEEQKDMNVLITQRLIPALEFLNKQAGRPVHVLGYCMGGTMLAAAATLAPDKIKSLIFLAAPWDFHAGSGALKARVEFWAPTMLPLIAEKGPLSVDWIQMLFASLDPVGTSEKFAKFAAMDPDSPQAQLFVAVEDWLNDGVDLPGAVAHECIHGWFFENKPPHGTWNIGSASIKPGAIKCPALVIASTKDRLVEYDSAAALQKFIGNTKIINPECGHIGMIAGDKAVSKVWESVKDWLGV